MYFLNVSEYMRLVTRFSALMLYVTYNIIVDSVLLFVDRYMLFTIFILFINFYQSMIIQPKKISVFTK